MSTTPRPMPEPARAAEAAVAAPVADEALTETEKFILEMLERLDAADAKAEHLQLALNHSRDIGAAVGILMAQHKMQQTEAFELLRRTSQDQNRKLYELALDVVRTGEFPSIE
ncbi:ANTAR domain-containing protein [Humibacillus xanthopallidus]|uniref:ANTAR domain-containing protein n=1 Tax=Humibacillus xanthopallidus TaxID=412689 RepID=UPI001639A7D0|nr:ANTAR domain-containing protein [Humibacillus xanthopallidus]